MKSQATLKTQSWCFGHKTGRLRTLVSQTCLAGQPLGSGLPTLNPDSEATPSPLLFHLRNLAMVTSRLSFPKSKCHAEKTTSPNPDAANSVRVCAYHRRIYLYNACHACHGLDTLSVREESFKRDLNFAIKTKYKIQLTFNTF